MRYIGKEIEKMFRWMGYLLVVTIPLALAGSVIALGALVYLVYKLGESL